VRTWANESQMTPMLKSCAGGRVVHKELHEGHHEGNMVTTSEVGLQFVARITKNPRNARTFSWGVQVSLMVQHVKHVSGMPRHLGTLPGYPHTGLNDLHT
jgi:hypothetical protein